MRISDWSSDVCSSDLPSSFAIDSMPPACCKMSVRFMAFLHLRRGSKCADRGWYSSAQAGRSEEHTSDLQSLMRTSYAVFCSKKKMTMIHCSIHSCGTSSDHNTRPQVITHTLNTYVVFTETINTL